MNKVFLIGQRLTIGNSVTHLLVFSNKIDPRNGMPTWYSGQPHDFVVEPVRDTKRWMANAGFEQFCLEFIYDS